MFKRIGLVILITLAFIAGYSKPVYALAEPTSVSLTGILVFEDVIATGDFLAIVPYQVSYASNPSHNIDATFIFRLLSPDGATENGTVLAYPYTTGGYGHGVVSFYFASGMTSGASYIFRVQQNPTLYPAAQYWDFTISNDNYSTESNEAAAIKAKVLDSAAFLSTQYGVALTTSGQEGSTVLSASGELYYLNAIPGLQSMSPNLFEVNLDDPDYTKRTWSTTFAETLRTRYSGTLIGEFMTGYAGLLSTTTTATATVLSLLLATVLMLISVWKGRASMLSGTVDGYTILLLFMLIGIFPMEAAGGIAFASTVTGGVVLFLNRS